MHGFDFYKGDLIGLTANENYLVFRWNNTDCKILYSITQKGKAISAHVASDKKGLRYLKIATNEFCEFCFNFLPWCEMIFAFIKNRPSIEKLSKKCDFKFIGSKNDIKIYVRER